VVNVKHDFESVMLAHIEPYLAQGLYNGDSLHHFSDSLCGVDKVLVDSANVDMEKYLENINYSNNIRERPWLLSFH
jgi:hypothetical protein